jgi:tetratricopeptide (TPR) repeat protein
MKRKKPSRPKSQASQRPQLSRRKKLVFSLIAIPLMLLLLELGLGLCGVKPALYEMDPYVGFSTYVPLFVEEKLPDGTTQYVTAENKMRLFNRQAFPREKPSGSYRIFSLGGSTTHGRPYDDKTSFSGWLREYLKVTSPERHWEVINAGGVSYASYRVALLMEELSQYEPDLFIIYTGHNEFLEERTYGRIKDTPAVVQRISTWAARSRAATLVSNAIQSVASWWSEPVPTKTVLQSEVVTRLDNSVGPSAYTRDDTQRDQVLKHYRYNLLRMIDIANSVGAKVILITPASNLRGASPFKSEHKNGLPENELRRWEAQYQSARESLRQGAPAEALTALEQAATIDDRYADLHFLRGHALAQLGRYEQAKVALVRALDEDICPLRALSPIRGIVEQVAVERNIPWIDFVAIQEQHSPHGIPGATVFFDHVHPMIEAQRILALEILGLMAREGIVKPSLDGALLQQVKDNVMGRIDPQAHAQALMNLSKVLGWAGKLREAYRLAAKAAELYPENVAVQYQAGLTAQLTGKRDESIDHYRKALEIEPTAALVHGNLGVGLESRGDLERAIHHYRLALQYGDPKDAARNRRNLARAEEKLRQR